MLENCSDMRSGHQSRTLLCYIPEHSTNMKSSSRQGSDAEMNFHSPWDIRGLGKCCDELKSAKTGCNPTKSTFYGQHSWTRTIL